MWRVLIDIVCHTAVALVVRRQGLLRSVFWSLGGPTRVRVCRTSVFSMVLAPLQNSEIGVAMRTRLLSVRVRRTRRTE